MQWALILADFDFEICHTYQGPGIANQAADSLSRNPVDGLGTVNVLPNREILTLSKKEEDTAVLMNKVFTNKITPSLEKIVDFF